MILFFNSFWGILYPGTLRYPFYLILLLLRLYRLSSFRIKKKSVALVAILPIILAYFGINTFIYFTAVFVIFLLMGKLLIATSSRTLLTVSRLVIYISVTFVLAVNVFLNGEFYLLEDYISLEPSNLAFTVMFFLLYGFFYGRKINRIETVVAFIIFLALYESLTMIIGLSVFAFCLLGQRFTRLVLFGYLVTALLIPIIFITNPDLLTQAKLYFASINHASGYVWFNGWDAAVYAYSNNNFGSGVLTSNNYYRDPTSNDLLDNLNLRGLGTLNAFYFAMLGNFYFLIIGYFIFISRNFTINPATVILAVYLFMLMARWAGIFNSTFLLAVAFASIIAKSHHNRKEL